MRIFKIKPMTFINYITLIEVSIWKLFTLNLLGSIGCRRGNMKMITIACYYMPVCLSLTRYTYKALV